MNTTTHTIILDSEDVRGLVDNEAVQRGDPTLWITLENGDRLLIPASLLTNNERPPFRIGQRWDDLVASHKAPTVTQEAVGDAVLPFEENNQVEQHGTGSSPVRVRKITQEEDTLVQTAVIRQEMDVERVPKNEPLDEMPTVRYEGDTLVIPVVEEVVVVEKRLVLKEEIRVNRHQLETPWEQVVPVHKESVVIERSLSDNAESTIGSE
jgi:uncharacterized protein (TIGR02271 family)